MCTDVPISFDVLSISIFITIVCIQLFRERLSEKKHQIARNKTERLHGYSLEFCILA